MIEKVKLDPLHSNNIEFISERWYQVQQALLMGSQRNDLNSQPTVKVETCSKSQIFEILLMLLDY